MIGIKYPIISLEYYTRRSQAHHRVFVYYINNRGYLDVVSLTQNEIEGILYTGEFFLC